MASVLLVDDEPSILSVLSTLLKKQGFDVVPALGGEKAEDLLREQGYDLLISDIRMGPIDGLELLKIAKQLHPGMAVIMITAFGSVESAVEAMRMGAFDYVTKPFKVDELMITVQRALEYRRALSENEQLKEQLEARYGFENMVAESSEMRRICSMIERVAPTDQTVLIGGESGVGKEVVAKAIHGRSVRRKQVFVPINCAALPEPLLESELFGHVKGAFTGAATDKEGLFEVAHEGTIFLDEIGSMPLSLQSKLLRVLQENEIRRVGGTKTITINVRVVAASNEDLETQISQGKFREDLFYRLSVIPMYVPSLRERPADILPLAFHFVRSAGGEHPPELSADVQLLLESYAWPRNVRELQNAIQHACTFAEEGVVQIRDLPAKISKGNSGAAGEGSAVSAGANGNVFADYEGKSLKAFLRAVEKAFISDVIEKNHGDKNAAAKQLGVSLATLYRKLPDPD